MALTLTQEEFLQKYNIIKSTFESANITYSELIEIHNHYEGIKISLEPTAKSIADCLLNVNSVHSVRYRIKHPEHLLEKIIRKRAEGRQIDINNYQEEITDFIGVRVLHLFKEEWETIHDFILKEWELLEKPKANIRQGDLNKITKRFKEKDCDVAIHKAGYRSVHYLLVTNLTKKRHITEVQVRTIFEEAWSEIDHKIRYPYKVDDEILREYLEIFNRLAGSADEMGSFIRDLNLKLSASNQHFERILNDKEKTIAELRNEIERLKLQSEDLQRYAFKSQPIESGSESQDLNIIEGIYNSPVTPTTIKRFLAFSPAVHLLDKNARSSGFTEIIEIDDTEIESSLQDLLNYLSEVKLINYQDIESFIFDNINDVAKFFAALYQKRERKEWRSNSQFHLILLLIYKYPEQLNYNFMIHNGWHPSIAQRVIDVLGAENFE